MTDRSYIVSRMLEEKIAIAENNDQNTLIVTLGVLKEIFALLKDMLKKQDNLKQKMWNALYAEEDELEKKFVGTEELHDNWFYVYRPWLQRGFEIAIKVIAEEDAVYNSRTSEIKDQEAVPVTQREVMHMLVWCCGSCGVAITEGDKFCRMCGKKVKWNA